MNVLKTLRNHWKKSVFITAIAAYGARYARDTYNESLILKAYCLEAKKYGDVMVRGEADRPRRVTVFLNPAASRGKGRSLFEKKVAPILNLAGLEVNVIITEYEGQAKKYMDVLEHTDAILVAGGSGTLSEVITGLLRRADQEQVSKIPLGVIPLGYTNTLAKSLCPKTESTSVFINEMAMSAVRGVTKPVDVIHVKGEDNKSVYAVLGIDWGSYTDTEIRKKKYWYFGPLKHQLAYAISTLRYWPSAYDASLSYVLPCDGCGQCFIPPPTVRWRWWHLLIPPKRQAIQKDYSNVVNEACGKVHSEPVSLTEFTARTQNCNRLSHVSTEESKGMKLITMDSHLTKMEFIKRGLSRMQADNEANQIGPVSGQTEGVHETLAKEFTLAPILSQEETTTKNKERWLYIDNEPFELKTITCRLLPDKLRFFYSEHFTVPTDDVTR